MAEAESGDGDDEGVGCVDGGGVTQRRRLEGQVGRQHRQGADEHLDQKAKAFRDVRRSPPRSDFRPRKGWMDGLMDETMDGRLNR